MIAGADNNYNLNDELEKIVDQINEALRILNWLHQFFNSRTGKECCCQKDKSAGSILLLTRTIFFFPFSIF
ncbi:MAG: hypothetical protein ABIQ74_04210 [Chitinophagales bacterium]